MRTASILGRLAPDEARWRSSPRASAPRRAGAHPRAAGDRHAGARLRAAGRRRPPARLPVAVRGAAGHDAELRLARAAAAEAAALVGPDADAQLLRRRHEQQLVVSLLSAEPRQVETAATALEAEHYLPLRPVCVWVAAPAGPAGDEWSAEALDRLRARLAAKQAICAEFEGRLVCLGGGAGWRRARGAGGARAP